jgi:hypothetical protein
VPARPGNAYIRQGCILPHLAALHLLLTGTQAAGTVHPARSRPQPAPVI